MKLTWLCTTAVLLVLTGCGSAPRVTSQMSLAELAKMTAGKIRDGLDIHPSKNGKIALVSEKGDRYSDTFYVPRNDFADWCKVHDGKLRKGPDQDPVVRDDPALAKSVTRIENYATGLLAAEGLAVSPRYNLYCDVRGEFTVYAADVYNWEGRSLTNSKLYWISAAELETHGPAGIAALAAKAQEANLKREREWAERKVKSAQYEAQAARDRQYTDAQIAGYKHGTRMICVGSNGRAVHGVFDAWYLCNQLPSTLNLQTLILGGWNIVTQQETDERFTVVIEKK